MATCYSKEKLIWLLSLFIRKTTQNTATKQIIEIEISI